MDYNSIYNAAFNDELDKIARPLTRDEKKMFKQEEKDIISTMKSDVKAVGKANPKGSLISKGSLYGGLGLGILGTGVGAGGAAILTDRSMMGKAKNPKLNAALAGLAILGGLVAPTAGVLGGLKLNGKSESAKKYMGAVGKIEKKAMRDLFSVSDKRQAIMYGNEA